MLSILSHFLLENLKKKTKKQGHINHVVDLLRISDVNVLDDFSSDAQFTHPPSPRTVERSPFLDNAVPNSAAIFPGPTAPMFHHQKYRYVKFCSFISSAKNSLQKIYLLYSNQLKYLNIFF